MMGGRWRVCGLRHCWLVAWALLVLMDLSLVAGCSSYRNQAFRTGAASEQEQDGYLLRFVEADDEGWLWSPKQAEDALESVRQSAEQRDTFVVIFVHGWHHSARCCDGNVEGFKETLSRLHEQLATLRKQTHANDGRGEDFRLIGIYAGWRGASLPGLLDYATFWGRKSAAQRTGEGDLREFLDRLNQLYQRHNEPAAPGRPAESAQTFLGLVTIGHSFGGQVVLRSVYAALEQELQTVTPVAGYLRNPLPAPPVATRRPMRGFGDLVVLVNPAVESAAYQRLRLLSQQLTYPDQQTPVLLTVSAENDYPRGRLFTWGRILGEWFTGKPYDHDAFERDTERQALGIYNSLGVQITHHLVPTDTKVSLVADTKIHTPEPYCKDAESCSCEWLTWKPSPSVTPPDSLLWPRVAAGNPNLDRYDFSQDLVLRNVELKPVGPITPYQPFIVAEASRSIIDGHSGIFTDPFVDFLTTYIGFIEGKEYQLLREGKPGKHTPVTHPTSR